MLSRNDLDELKRISTNVTGDERAFINRVINEVSRMSNEINQLKIKLKAAESENKSDA